MRSELLSEDEITNLLGFFGIIKPRRIENLQSQQTIFSDPAFSVFGKILIFQYMYHMITLFLDEKFKMYKTASCSIYRYVLYLRMCNV